MPGDGVKSAKRHRAATALRLVLKVAAALILGTCGFFPSNMADLSYVGSDYVTFSQDSGFYTTSVTVALNTPNSKDVVLYTTDGSTPSLDPYGIFVTTPPYPPYSPPSPRYRQD